MTQVIAFETPDGLVSLLYAAPGVSISSAAADIPDNAIATWWMGDDTELPDGFRDFIEAIALNGNKAPGIDMAKAREISRSTTSSSCWPWRKVSRRMQQLRQSKSCGT